jgi:hypothetical protein
VTVRGVLFGVGCDIVLEAVLVSIVLVSRPGVTVSGADLLGACEETRLSVVSARLLTVVATVGLKDLSNVVEYL